VGLRGLTVRQRVREVRARRGPAPLPDAGMVTLEAALAALSLTAVTAALVGAFVVLGAQLRVNDAVRVAARAEAAGAADAVALGQRSAPGATVTVVRDGAVVLASAVHEVRLPLAVLPPIRVVARAEVVDEAAVLGWGP